MRGYIAHCYLSGLHPLNRAVESRGGHAIAPSGEVKEVPGRSFLAPSSVCPRQPPQFQEQPDLVAPMASLLPRTSKEHPVNSVDPFGTGGRCEGRDRKSNSWRTKHRQARTQQITNPRLRVTSFVVGLFPIATDARTHIWSPAAAVLLTISCRDTACVEGRLAGVGHRPGLPNHQGCNCGATEQQWRATEY